METQFLENHTTRICLTLELDALLKQKETEEHFKDHKAKTR